MRVILSFLIVFLIGCVLSSVLWYFILYRGAINTASLYSDQSPVAYVPVYLNSTTEQLGPQRFFTGLQSGNAQLFYSSFSQYFISNNPNYKDYYINPKKDNLPLVHHEGSFLMPIGEYLCLYDVLFPTGRVMINFMVDSNTGLIDEINPPL